MEGLELSFIKPLTYFLRTWALSSDQEGCELHAGPDPTVPASDSAGFEPPVLPPEEPEFLDVLIYPDRHSEAWL